MLKVYGFVLMLFSIALFGFSDQIYSNQIRNDKGKRQLPGTIKWSPDYKLNVNDFKSPKYDFKSGKHDTSKFKVLAYSCVAIGYSFSTEKGKLIVDAFGLFYRDSSWMKAPDEATLKHEQGHFDITEIYARKFEKAVRAMDNIKDPSFWTSFQKTYDEINALHLKEQDKYDDYAFTGLGQDYYYKKILDDLKATE
jgi:hypothetical protein